MVSQGGSHTEYPLGFGLGTMLSRSIDLRTWFLFPDMNQDAAARTWGAGVALADQVRVAGANPTVRSTRGRGGASSAAFGTAPRI